MAASASIGPIVRPPDSNHKSDWLLSCLRADDEMNCVKEMCSTLAVIPALVFVPCKLQVDSLIGRSCNAILIENLHKNINIFQIKKIKSSRKLINETEIILKGNLKDIHLKFWFYGLIFLHTVELVQSDT
jgi:hypothetical protein